MTRYAAPCILFPALMKNVAEVSDITGGLALLDLEDAQTLRIATCARSQTRRLKDAVNFGRQERMVRMKL